MKVIIIITNHSNKDELCRNHILIGTRARFRRLFSVRSSPIPHCNPRFDLKILGGCDFGQGSVMSLDLIMSVLLHSMTRYDSRYRVSNR